MWVWYDYTLQCSAVGDEEDWRYDTTDDSSSKYIDVGYKDGENEIEQHPAQHHEQSLPGRFAAHFPGLRFGFQGFSVHRLVHHSGNFAITTERKPSYAIFSVGILGFEAEQGLAPHIKKEIELFYPYFENFCKCEMPQLVKKYENGKGQYHLQGFD